MRYHRGITKFLIPSIFIHIILFTLAFFLYNNDYKNYKLKSYEIGIIKLDNKNNITKYEIQQVNKIEKSIKEIYEHNINISKINPVVKINEDNKKLNKNIPIKNVTTEKDNFQAVSNTSVTSSIPKIADGINNISESAYPDYNINPKPDYPVIARRRGYQGTVLVKVNVLENGKVGRVDIERSSNYKILDTTALNAVSEWVFFPAKKNGVSVPSSVTIPIIFELKDRQHNLESNAR